jgi:hypothetical protein
VQGVRETWALPDEDPSLKVETVRPELPHPDFDEDEVTVEPEMTEFYHGDITQAEAEERLNSRKEGQFLLRAAPSTCCVCVCHCSRRMATTHVVNLYHVVLARNNILPGVNSVPCHGGASQA